MMKVVIAVVAGIALGLSAAYAESKKQRLTDQEMDQVYAGVVGIFKMGAMRVGGENNSEIIVVPTAVGLGGAANGATNAIAQHGKTKAPAVTHPGNVESRLRGK